MTALSLLMPAAKHNLTAILSSITLIFIRAAVPKSQNPAKRVKIIVIIPAIVDDYLINSLGKTAAIRYAGPSWD